jgi:hypothetical protein
LPFGATKDGKPQLRCTISSSKSARISRTSANPRSSGIRVAFKTYRASVGDDAAPTKASLQQFVVRLRERGVRPVTCNTYIGAMNAFCAWLHQQGHVAVRIKLAKLRVERRVLILLADNQIRALIASKPTTFGSGGCNSPRSWSSTLDRESPRR